MTTETPITATEEETTPIAEEITPTIEETTSIAEETTPIAEAITPQIHPFAAQIDAVFQLPDEAKNDPIRVKAHIAAALGETTEKPLTQLEKVIEAIGTRKALKLLVKTFKVEGNGGLMIYNNTRKRTLGGIYFFLAQRWVKPQFRALIWPELFPGHATIAWADRIELIKEAVKEMGIANVPRLILMGRPGKIIEKGKVVLTTMAPKPQPKSLPRGIPTMPEEPTTPYILYIGSKQWRKVKDSLNDKEDELIIEGYPTFNPQLKAITVFATKTTTKVMEESRRVKQRPEATPAPAESQPLAE